MAARMLGQHAIVRIVSGILFAVGIPWSLIAWIAIGGPAVSLENLIIALRYHELLLKAIVQIPLLLFFSVQAALGYRIWASWFLIAVGRRAASRRFWALASMHHLAWIVYAGAAYDKSSYDLPSPIVWYCSAVLVACIVATVANFETPSPSGIVA